MADMREAVVAVVPAYQAEKTVGDVVRGVVPWVERVLVVDDGSSDGTAAEARDAGAHVHHLPSNSGKGTALAAAFAILRSEGVDAALTIDADGQHLASEAVKLMARRDADLVLGVRNHLFHHMSLVRRLSNRISSRAIAALAGVDAPDVQTGFRLYRRPLFEPGLLPPGRFESESVVLVNATRRGLRVAVEEIEMAVVDGRGSSHYRALTDSARIGLAVLRARFHGGSG